MMMMGDGKERTGKKHTNALRKYYVNRETEIHLIDIYIERYSCMVRLFIDISCKGIRTH